MNHMVLNNAVEDMSTNKSKLAIDGRRRAFDKGPFICLVVKRLGMSMMKVRDSN